MPGSAHPTADDNTMTLEKSHAAVYSLRVRSRDLAADVPPPIRTDGRDARGRWTGANHAARNRAAKHALTGALRASLASAVAAAVPEDREAQTRVQRAALALYRAAAQELQTESTLARSALVRWAVGSAVSQALTLAAVAAGVDSERGLRLLAQAERQSQLAERSSIAAADLARALRKPAAAANPTHAAILGAGKAEP